MKTGVLVSRFQPFSSKHKEHIEYILSQNDRCLVMVRDTKNDDSLLPIEERIAHIMKVFSDNNNVFVQPFPDPGEDLTIYLDNDIDYEII